MGMMSPEVDISGDKRLSIEHIDKKSKERSREGNEGIR